MVRIFYILLLCIYLSSCFRAPIINIVRDKDHQENVYIGQNLQLYYFGELTKESNLAAKKLYNQAEIKPSRLIIFSGGGDVYLGMELGEFVFDNKLDVEINKLCFSSCANYIFTAAQNKFLNTDSVLAWHGSSWQPDMIEKLNKGQQWVVKWRKAETDFFDKIHVDPKITVNGIKQYKFSHYLKAIVTFSPINGFNYSIEDMKKFGVDNVSVISGQWNWKKANKCCHVIRVKAF